MDHAEVFFATADGVRLYARDQGPRDSRLATVVCLPGLTRNAKDFETIAPRLARTRRVISPDFRGRGQSGRAADPLTYRPDVELADTLALLDSLGVGRAAIVGTSRGGIVAMLMAAKAPGRIAGIALNDIGPRIDKRGLLRIRTYLGRDPQFENWEDAAAALKATTPGFPNLSQSDWLIFARRVFRDHMGQPRADYDAELTRTFPTPEDIEGNKVPELWGLFDLLVNVPAVVLRGEHSDLLSEDTVAEMQRRHPNLAAVTVAGRGHVPFLDEPESITAIDAWLSDIDRAG
jgi:pimeloyl-ACP methyl ester carboxylesterase